MFSRFGFIGIAAILLWIKTYIIYKVGFDIKIENPMQEFILFMSPLSSILLFLGLSLFVKDKWRNRVVMIVFFALSFVLVGNKLFYSFFDDFVTVPVLFQTENMSDLSSSVLDMLNIGVILMLADVVILYFLNKKLSGKFDTSRFSYKARFAYFLSVVTIFVFTLGLAEAERPQLLTRTFDREMLVKNLGIFNYHIYDVALQARQSSQRALADSSEIVEVQNYTSAKGNTPNKKMYAKAKDMNVVAISAESLQSFVINNTLHGEEVTPFLNDFIKESYYFNNFYHQTGQGKTSDSEFVTETSLYPLDRGSVFFTHSGNKFNALSGILSENGYYTSVFHANNSSFWNRDIIYPRLGVNKFYDIDSFNVTEENSVGWGLKDKDFFDQSIDYLKEQPQPFYSKFITLTNHHPYDLEDEDKSIEPFNSSSATLNKYFTTVRYMDEAIEDFVNDLKESGLYDNTIIVIYGDHYGISENHKKAMAQYLDKEITAFEQTQLQKVPFIVHFPNQKKGEVIDTVTGQIDYKPTILNLLGIKNLDDISFGTDVFSKDNDDFTVLRDGSFISDEYVYTAGVLYDKATGEVIEDQSVAESLIEKSKQELSHSDKLIYGDLLRFYESK